MGKTKIDIKLKCSNCRFKFTLFKQNITIETVKCPNCDMFLPKNDIDIAVTRVLVTKIYKKVL
jgi:hypothetical protein